MISIAGVELEMFERGQGAPIFYLHGGAGIGPDLPFLDLLAQARRVIAPSHHALFQVSARAGLWKSAAFLTRVGDKK